MMTKKGLRQKMRALLSAQSGEDRKQKSRVIQKKLWRHPSFLNASTVCFYVALPMEVNTHPMIKESLKMGKKVLVPSVDLENKELKLKEIRDFREDLAPGALGILEPVSTSKKADARDVECCVVPGLAFDGHANRLGRGGGYYDRLLEKLPENAAKIGLAFSFQVLPKIPLENCDRPLDIVLTEK